MDEDEESEKKLKTANKMITATKFEVCIKLLIALQ